MKLTIPVSYLSDFKAFLVKLNKKATKQGLKPISATYGDEYETDQTLVGCDSKDTVLKVMVLDIELSDHVPTFNGYSFVASVESLDTGENIFHGSNTLEIPNKFKTSGHTCEHCNQNRKRNSSYIIQSPKGFKQVGSTCINDFLGNDKALNAFKFQDYIFCQLEEFERESNGNAVKSLLPVAMVLGYAVQVIAKHGFVKASDYDGYGPSPTRNRVELAMTYGNESFEELTAENALQGEAIKLHFAELPQGESEYTNKLSALCRASSCDRKNLAILVSAVATYQRKAREAKPDCKSEFVGSIGDKLTLQVKVNHTHVLPDYGYGESMLITFEDTTGNIYLWKSSQVRDLEKDSTHIIKGSIKEHSEYKGTNQTVLTRCKFID